jgi:surface carbohydrate biosynthesis protein (TIGR04326 family)
MESLSSDYKFTFRPHPAYAVDLAKYPGLQADETTGALHLILADFDIVLTTAGTSAALDTYLSSLPVIIYLNGSEFNLSPLRGHSGVCFISTSEELTEALEMTKQNVVGIQGGEEFFFLDPELPRWQTLLRMN